MIILHAHFDGHGLLKKTDMPPTWPKGCSHIYAKNSGSSNGEISTMSIAVTHVPWVSVCNRHSAVKLVVENRHNDTDVRGMYRIHGGVSCDYSVENTEPDVLSNLYMNATKRFDIKFMIESRSSLRDVMDLVIKVNKQAAVPFIFKRDCYCTDYITANHVESGYPLGETVLEMLHNDADLAHKFKTVDILGSYEMDTSVSFELSADLFVETNQGTTVNSQWLDEYHAAKLDGVIAEISKKHETKIIDVNNGYYTKAEELLKLVPDMGNQTVCPADGCKDTSTVHALIQHLNDFHQWKRERVADWMDDLVKDHGWSFNFPTPDEIKKSGKPTFD